MGSPGARSSYRLQCSPAVQGHTSLAHSIDLLFSGQDSQDRGQTRKCGCEDIWEIRLFVSRSIHVGVGGINVLAERVVVAVVRGREDTTGTVSATGIADRQSRSHWRYAGDIRISARYADRPVLQFTSSCRRTQKDVDRHCQSAKPKVVSVRRAIFIFRQDMLIGLCCSSASDVGRHKRMLTGIVSWQGDVCHSAKYVDRPVLHIFA